MSFLLGWDDGAQRGTEYGFTPSRPPNAGGRRLIADPHDEGHWLCVAPMGTGKSSGFAIPQLLSHVGPMIVVDIKGELTRVTARHRRSLGPVLVFDPFRQVSDGSGAFDPLAHLDPGDPSAVDDAYALARLFGSPSTGNRVNEAFWEEWGQDVIAALILAARTHADPTKRTLGHVYEMASSDDTVYNLAVFMDKQGHTLNRFARGKLGSFLSLPEQTRGGVMATFQQQLRMLAGTGVQHALRRNSLPMARLTRGQPCTIFLVVPPDKVVSHAALIRIVLTALVQRMMRRRGRGESPTMILIDEATQFGPIPAIEAAITLGRSYGLRAALMVQSLAQLHNAYGPATAAVIENCSMMTMGRHMAFSMSRQLANEGFGDVAPEELFALKEGEVMVRIRGQPSRRLKRLSYLTDAPFAGRFDANPFYAHKS